MKKIMSIISFSVIAATSSAQKQTFDVISFSIPKGWQQTKNEGGLQLSVTDKKTGAYAIAIITKAKSSAATADDNFSNDWLKLVRGSVQVNTEPVMEQPSKENGWDIISGGANYTDAGNTGLATLLTATGGSQTVSVLLMTNSKLYQNELVAFINSVQLAKASQKGNENLTPVTNGTQGKSAIIGLWCYYNTESNGSYNGFPQLTGGYFRKEYIFYADGSYLYRQKNWAVTVKEIQFIYETGSWSANGTKLTITPKQGEAGWWSKAKSGRTDEWGSLVKKGTWKVESVTYTFDLHYYPAINETHLLMQSGMQTEREGKQDNNTATYSPRVLDKGLIDNPPGFKTGFENKSLSAAAPIQTNSPTAGNTFNAPLTGKIWEGTSSEKFTGAGAMTGHYTGGFSTVQYTFNTNGTYRFVDVLASFYTDTKTLKYEAGTWSVNGTQLTINPATGQNEEWSKVGKTSNGNSDVTNRAINETWGKKLKANSRKLEKYTYSFSIGKNGDKNALVLQRNGRTERDGDGNTSYLNETSLERSVKLPVNIK